MSTLLLYIATQSGEAEGGGGATTDHESILGRGRGRSRVWWLVATLAGLSQLAS